MNYLMALYIHLHEYEINCIFLLSFQMQNCDAFSCA